VACADVLGPLQTPGMSDGEPASPGSVLLLKVVLVVVNNEGREAGR
jgi:hypothetical protein